MYHSTADQPDTASIAMCVLYFISLGDLTEKGYKKKKDKLSCQEESSGVTVATELRDDDLMSMTIAKLYKKQINSIDSITPNRKPKRPPKKVNTCTSHTHTHTRMHAHSHSRTLTLTHTHTHTHTDRETNSLVSVYKLAICRDQLLLYV